jgi:uncharacterized protein with FMN-binding domain
MKENSYFRARWWNLVLVALILFGYNQMLEKKELQAALQSSNEQLEQLETLMQETVDEAESSNGEETSWQDGVYEGVGTGFGGEITTSVTIEDGKITDVEIVSAPNEDEAYLSTAKQVLANIVQAQSAQVDTISGATFSSTGIIEGVNAALSEAVK